MQSLNVLFRWSQFTTQNPIFLGLQSKGTIYSKVFHPTRIVVQPQSQKSLKVLQNLLVRCCLEKRRKLIIWHDVRSNLLSAHKSKNYEPCSIDFLCQILKIFEDNIAAVLYCKRFGLRNVYKQLSETGITIIDVRKRLISKRKQKNPKYVQKLGLVHPPTSLESRLVKTIVSRLRKLQTPEKFSKKQRAPRTKFSKKQQDKIKKANSQSTSVIEKTD